ncbi:hypothetical protein H3U50_04040 [Lactobacillus sp. M0398]|uniref:hypothetical protein n=1 Tax=unclassified Lactobacillus TaxID=2620435 RepID=UPI0018DDE53D|nr:MULTISPECIES: hypothetical protein [unclassified Lactobacillus]MBI0033649.1 hypothetical protein [Lactobacillus sp. M0396]MBI0120985.1 hypothetical protein [Lactobacillus sp. M0398]MBI0123132.1 hypothetical protein [Lactobacillus sp. W8174]MBI0135300.1 hypothetical protein [Lactobacillus sp. W8173]
MKKSLSIAAIAAVFGASLIFSATSSNYVPVKAADVSDTNTVVNNQGVSDKTWSNKLTKAGYVFKLAKNIATTDGGLYQRKNGLLKKYSLKHAKKVFAKNMLFKIDRAISVENGSLVHIVSQNGKYKFWTNFLTGTYNVNGHKKSLKPLIKTEVEMITNTSKEKIAKKLVTAEKLANKLKGSDKKLAQESITQLKQWIDNEVFANIPVLLIGSL